MTEALQNLEAEAAVLGAVLLNGALMAEAAHQLEPRHFAGRQNARIFEAMHALFERGDAIDEVTLPAELGGDLPAVGGRAAIGKLVDGVPRSTSIEEWAGEILRRARRRAAHNLGVRLVEAAKDEEAEIDETLDRHSSALSRLVEVTSSGTVLDMPSVLKQAMASIDRFVQGTGVTGIPSGLPDLDEVIGGWQPGTLVVVAARPGQGKSTILAQFVAQAGARDLRGLVFSMEMTPASMVERMVFADAGVEKWDLKVRAAAFAKISQSVGKLRSHRTLFDSRESPTLAQICSRAKTLHQRARLDYIAVDYMQRVSFDARMEERIGVGQTAQGLKSLARHLSVPILTAAQLSRAAEAKEPTLADLAESGKIEREADVVAFLHPDQETKNLDYPTTNFIVAKHRQGACRRFKLYFEKRFNRFLPAAREQANAQLPRGDR